MEKDKVNSLLGQIVNSKVSFAFDTLADIEFFKQQLNEFIRVNPSVNIKIFEDYSTFHDYGTAFTDFKQKSDIDTTYIMLLIKNNNFYGKGYESENYGRSARPYIFSDYVFIVKEEFICLKTK